MQTTGILLTAWAIAVSISDIRERRVPNWLVGLGVVFACVSFVLARDASMATPVQGLLGAVLAFVVFLPLYAFGAMGAADVKVFAVLGLWLGAGMLVPVWLWASAAAGIHAVYAIARMRLRPVAMQEHGFAHGAESGRPGRSRFPMRGAPYAAFLALAALGVFVNQYPSCLPGF
jgi:prepilin peptidase CpaA